MKTKSRAKSAPSRKGTARKAYVSFNRDEWAALERLGYRERWAYMQLKWLANFKTGMVGNFRKQKITYTSLAQLVTAPGVQGRGMGNIDDTQAADFLQRMQVVGLVGSIATRPNGGLCFDLPLSPIDRAPAMVQPVTAPATPISPDRTTREAGYFPDADVPPFDEMPVSTRGLPTSTPSLSVMTLKESNINTDGAPSAPAEAAPPSRAAGAAAALENPPGTPSLDAPTWDRPLTAKQIHDDLAEDWDWAEVDSLQAESLYNRWAFEGITADRLFQAKAAVMAASPGLEQPHTPAELLAHLYPNHPDSCCLAA